MSHSGGLDVVGGSAAQFERRFGGLRRLYGQAGAKRIFAAHVVVVGIGGVGSWAAEALARSGVARLSLIDMDHIAASNFNRQIHADLQTEGQSKVQAMRERIARYHPDCQVDLIDAFVDSDNWANCLQQIDWQAPFSPMDRGLIDACDKVSAKATMAAWAVEQGLPFVAVGAAGGKRLAHQVDLGDLAGCTGDPLLAQLRYRLRRHHAGARTGAMGVACVFSREPVAQAQLSAAQGPGETPAEQTDGGLNCHGYGSVVGVTATFGFCAAQAVLDALACGGAVPVPRPRVKSAAKKKPPVEDPK